MAEPNTSPIKANPWKRLAYIVLFIVIFGIAEWVTYVIVLVQFITNVFTGKSNERLRQLGQNIAIYAQQIIGFLTYANNDAPYPFRPWPGSEIPSQPLDLEPPRPPAPEPPSTSDNGDSQPRPEPPVDLGKPNDADDDTVNPDATDKP